MMHLLKGLLLIIALTYVTPAQEYIFQQLTVDDGLSQSTVFSTLQDSRGFMWFGTIDGLNKYDGYDFTIYSNDSNDSTTISDNVITSIFEDSKNQIWVGTVNGYLNKFNRNTETFDRYFSKDYLEIELTPPGGYYEHPLAFSRNMNISITSIAEDQHGYLWITTWGNGLLRFDLKNMNAEHIYHSKVNIACCSPISTKKFLEDKLDIINGLGGRMVNKLIQTNDYNEFQDMSVE
ncbi:MAG: hypothetical protein IH784_04085, partial [Bacteroidetes bacterium]|nr:hypothetical protein [Bacteroidota bacterium]